MKKIKELFLNEHFILIVIVLNASIIFAQESGITSTLLNILDLTCTMLFIIEMTVKHSVLGIKGYWKDGWNKLDGTLVILSIPSIFAFFLPESIIGNMSILLVLRLLRVLRFFRVIHVFPNFATILKNFNKAIKDSFGVFVGFFILIIIFALISCALYRDAAPQFFGTPIDSIYSIFRICTGEGWNEIPDTIADGSTLMTARWIRFYFCILLILFCIIGLSLVNSIFVDAMVSDNNDSLEKKVEEINGKLDKILNNDNGKI